MKKITMDGIGYYLSCMLLFHLIYVLKLTGDCFFSANPVKWGESSFWIIVADLTIVCVMICLGLFFTYLILRRDDSAETPSSLGTRVTITELEDLTGENYFTNYALLALTGLSLPTTGQLYCLGLYLLILVTLGIVYIKKALIYMNPVLTLANYSIYRCRDKGSGDNYIFIVRGDTLKEADTIEYNNTTRKIIRLNKVVRIKDMEEEQENGTL